MKRLIPFLCLICLWLSVQAGTVKLAWDPNPEPDVIGYNVYRSTQSGAGFVKINSTLLQSTGYVDDSAPAGAVFYVVTAVDSEGLESGFSSEVSTQVAAQVTPDYPAQVQAVIDQAATLRTTHAAQLRDQVEQLRSQLQAIADALPAGTEKQKLARAAQYLASAARRAAEVDVSQLNSLELVLEHLKTLLQQ